MSSNRYNFSAEECREWDRVRLAVLEAMQHYHIGDAPITCKDTLLHQNVENVKYWKIVFQKTAGKTETLTFHAFCDAVLFFKNLHPVLYKEFIPCYN